MVGHRQGLGRVLFYDEDCGSGVTHLADDAEDVGDDERGQRLQIRCIPVIVATEIFRALPARKMRWPVSRGAIRTTSGGEPIQCNSYFCSVKAIATIWIAPRSLCSNRMTRKVWFLWRAGGWFPRFTISRTRGLLDVDVCSAGPARDPYLGEAAEGEGARTAGAMRISSGRGAIVSVA